jgi:hypothetical protein
MQGLSSKRRLLRSLREKPSHKRSTRRFFTSADTHDPDDIRYCAMHEAGHAVAAVLLGIRLNGVDLKRRPEADGAVSVGFTDAPVPSRAIAGGGRASPEATMPEDSTA